MRKRINLVGFAIDLSGSMQSSIKNRTGNYINRFESIKDSLDELFKKAKRDIESQKNNEREKKNDTYFFAYGFGLKSREYCDLLTLIIKAARNSIYESGDVRIDISKFQRFNFPFDNLEEIASKHKKIGWGHLCSKKFSTQEAQILVNILIQNPKKAAKLCAKLPDDMLETGFDFARSISPFHESNIKNVEKEAKNAIRQIEEGKKKIEEEIKHLDEHTTMLIGEVADNIFNQNRTVFSEIEKYIYGRTPMVSTLKEVQRRIKIEETKIKKF